METKFNILAAAILLAAVTAAFGQPLITQQPKSCTNAVGTTATFTVTATGTTPLAYQWEQTDYFGNPTDLAGCTETNLVLTNVQTSLAGFYRVIVTNLDGAVTSQVATLTVVTYPPRINATANLQHLAVHLGSAASFTASASGMALSYQWRLDGRDLPGQTTSRLNITNAQPAEEGDYTVVVTNVVGAVTSAPARLWVVPLPSAFIRGDFTNGTFRYPYYYLMPTNDTPARSYPLVCFFHGAGGDEFTFTNGIPEVGWLGYANYPAFKVFASYRQQATDPAIVLCPTLCAGAPDWWPQYTQQATNLVDHFISRFKIDTNRLYVGGLSGGGPPACALPWFRPGFFAGAMVLSGAPLYTPITSPKDVPLWVTCATDDDISKQIIREFICSLRLAGANPIYTEYQTGGHMGGIGVNLCTPAIVDWLLAQRRGVAPTNEPLLTITNPTPQAVLFTGATNLNLAGSAAALGRDVNNVTWTNFANNAKGVASGTNFWGVTNVPLVANKTNIVVVVGTTTSWAPAYGGNTTFNDALVVVCYPIRATLTLQGPEATLNWTGGGPPYCVQRATDLAVGDWTDFLPDATAPVTLSPSGAAAFYRIVGQ